MVVSSWSCLRVLLLLELHYDKYSCIRLKMDSSTIQQQWLFEDFSVQVQKNVWKNISVPPASSTSGIFLKVKLNAQRFLFHTDIFINCSSRLIGQMTKDKFKVPDPPGRPHRWYLDFHFAWISTSCLLSSGFKCFSGRWEFQHSSGVIYKDA